MEGQAATAAAAAAEAATVTAQPTALPATTASWGNITNWSMSELVCEFICMRVGLAQVAPADRQCFLGTFRNSAP